MSDRADSYTRRFELKGAAREAYDEACHAARAAYQESTAPEWQAYEEATSDMAPDDSDARLPAWGSYFRDTAGAAKAFRQALDEGFASAQKISP